MQGANRYFLLFFIFLAVCLRRRMSTRQLGNLAKTSQKKRVGYDKMPNEIILGTKHAIFILTTDMKSTICNKISIFVMMPMRISLFSVIIEIFIWHI
jgi:hypothetical protein